MNKIITKILEILVINKVLEKKDKYDLSASENSAFYNRLRRHFKKYGELL